MFNLLLSLTDSNGKSHSRRSGQVCQCEPAGWQPGPSQRFPWHVVLGVPDYVAAAHGDEFRHPERNEDGRVVGGLLWSCDFDQLPIPIRTALARDGFVDVSTDAAWRGCAGAFTRRTDNATLPSTLPLGPVPPTNPPFASLLAPRAAEAQAERDHRVQRRALKGAVSDRDHAAKREAKYDAAAANVTAPELAPLRALLLSLRDGQRAAKEAAQAMADAIDLAPTRAALVAERQRLNGRGERGGPTTEDDSTLEAKRQAPAGGARGRLR